MEKVVSAKRLQSRFNNIEMSLGENQETTIQESIDVIVHSKINDLSANVNLQVFDLKTAIFKILETGVSELSKEIKQTCVVTNKYISKTISECQQTFKTSIVNYSPVEVGVSDKNHSIQEKKKLTLQKEKTKLSFLGFFENIDDVTISNFEINNIYNYDVFFAKYFSDFFGINEKMIVCKMQDNIKSLDIHFELKEGIAVVNLNYEIDIMPERWCKVLRNRIIYDLSLKIQKGEGKISCLHTYDLKKKRHYCNLAIEMPL